MRRPILILALTMLAALGGCSVYDALFGMLGDNYSSSSPDRASRHFEMQDEVDRWEQHERLSTVPAL